MENKYIFLSFYCAGFEVERWPSSGRTKKSSQKSKLIIEKLGAQRFRFVERLACRLPKKTTLMILFY